MSLLISNTSPLVALSAVGRLDLLHRLFDSVQIAPGVYREIVTNGQGWTNAETAQRAIADGVWLRAVPVSASPLLVSLARLGQGEAETIALAVQVGSPVLLDDLEARKVAGSLGLVVLGSLAIVAENKRTGHILAAKPIVRAMHDAGIYYSDRLLDKFLTDLGETWD